MPAEHLMDDAADYIEALEAEVSNLRISVRSLHKGSTALRTQLAQAVEALEAIQIESNRPTGGLVHLRRVVALNCRATLAAIAPKEADHG